MAGIVDLPFALVAFVVTVVWWSVGLAGISSIFWDWSIPYAPGNYGPFRALGVANTHANRVVLYTIAGGIMLVTLPGAVRLVALLRAHVARALLCGVSEMKEQIVGLQVRNAGLTDQRQAAAAAETNALRRIERDIHDGPQQRLVRVAMDLGRARQQMESDPDAARATIEEVLGQTRETLDELRALSRGIAPPILTDRGLPAALAALAARSPVPVDLRLPPDLGRLAADHGDDGLLRRRRGADQHRQAQPGRDRGGPRRHLRHRQRAGLDGRQRRRRRERRQGPRSGRAGRPGPSGRRRVRSQQPGRRPDRAPGGAAVRVIVADDSVLLREGLVRLLAENGHDVVAPVGDGPSFVSAVREYRPDVSIVDVRMPPSHTDEGLRAAVAVRRELPGAPILMLSQYVDVSYADDLLADRTGAIGYLLKDRVAEVSEFLDGLARVADGGTVLDPEVVAQLVVRRGRVPLDGLTVREREVLELMAEGRSNAAIAKALVVTDGAVEKHVKNIFMKLDLPPDDEQHRRVLAVLAYLRG